ncbi:MAG: TlpA family protein disulfide reductase [Pyrinomonadaceae bacterium]
MRLIFATIILVITGSVFAQNPAVSPRPDTLEKIELLDLDRQQLSIAGFRGQVVIVNTWGVWCAPCRLLEPTLNRLQQQYRDAGLIVLGLNIGDADSKAERYRTLRRYRRLRRIRYTLTRTSLDAWAEIEKYTRASVVPQTMVIDREGYVKGIFRGAGPKIDERMEELIKSMLLGSQPIPKENLPK